MADQPKFSINITDVDRSSFAIGDYSSVIQNNGLTQEEAVALQDTFERMRADVGAKAPPEQREEALRQATEVEQAVVAAQPDAGRVKRALRWFRDNAPALAGTVVSVILSPLVGKLVEGAGTELSKRFFEEIDEPR
jgi:hypothetical protein